MYGSYPVMIDIVEFDSKLEMKCLEWIFTLNHLLYSTLLLRFCKLLLLVALVFCAELEHLDSLMLQNGRQPENNYFLVFITTFKCLKRTIHYDACVKMIYLYLKIAAKWIN